MGKARNTKPHAIENIILEKLSIFEDAMRRSICDFHPRVLWRLFQSNVNLHQLGKEEVFCVLLNDPQAVHIQVEVSDRGSDDQWISDLVLVSSKERIQYLHRGRILGAQ